MSPADKLGAIGRALYGDIWQTPLANDLNVNRETIRRWLNGHTPLPSDHSVFESLQRLVKKRIDTLSKLL